MSAPRGVSAPGGGGDCSIGVSVLGGGGCSRRALLPGGSGGGIPACTEADPPPREQNHRKHNLAPASLRAVISCFVSYA